MTYTNQRFERIWDAEQLVRGEKVSVVFGSDMATREQAKKNLKRAEKELSDLLDSLSLEELQGYGEFRQAMNAEIDRRRSA
jgi:hypothetical protein